MDWRELGLEGKRKSLMREGLSGEEDPKWALRCSAVGWILRIAEEDGEVDEDFPRKCRVHSAYKYSVLTDPHSS